MISIDQGIKNRKNLTLEIDHLEIPQGLVTMIVSKNSGGKSTLLKLLSGAIELDEGSINIDNLPIDQYKKSSGIFYMPDRIVGQSKATVFRSIDIFEGMYPNFDPRTFERNLTSAGISLHLKLEELSKGQQKLYMFELFKMTQSRMLLLDEPTNGLDEENKTRFKNMIQTHLIDEKNYVIIASNSVEDIETISDHLIYIKNGRVFFEGNVLELEDRYRVWRGTENELPTSGIVGIRRKRDTMEVLIDTYVNPTETVERLELHDLLILLERGSR